MNEHGYVFLCLCLEKAIWIAHAFQSKNIEEQPIEVIDENTRNQRGDKVSLVVLDLRCPLDQKDGKQTQHSVDERNYLSLDSKL